jgi:hypothetical protein
MTPDRDELAPWGSEEAFEAGLRTLLYGPSPVNRIVGAIELDGRGRPVARPSQATIEAARNDILAALWGTEV